MKKFVVSLIFLWVLWSLTAIAGTVEMASATLKNADGETVGTISLEATPNGTLVHARFTKLTPGVHAFHIHSIGKCVPPFTSAGEHYNLQA